MNMVVIKYWLKLICWQFSVFKYKQGTIDSGNYKIKQTTKNTIKIPLNLLQEMEINNSLGSKKVFAQWLQSLFQIITQSYFSKTLHGFS